MVTTPTVVRRRMVWGLVRTRQWSLRGGKLALLVGEFLQFLFQPPAHPFLTFG
jgi:hypothetical protein